MTIAAPRGTFRGPTFLALPHLSARTHARVGLGMALLLAIVPLLWPSVPPLIDLPNHMSRYRVGVDYRSFAPFRAWFDFHWELVGNLGVDLLVTALAPLLGVEPATKLVVTAIPLLTVLGCANIAREVHGRVPATAAFAFLFAYNFPFNYGFVNYSLAVALALNAFALWIRWEGRARTRALAFVPVAFAVWLAHAVGWGVLGVLIFAWEWRGRLDREGWRRAVLAAAIACLPLAAPLVPMLLWFGSAGASTGVLVSYDPYRKIAMLFLALRNANAIVDVGSVAILWLALALAIGRRGIAFDPRLLAAATALGITYLLMPADMLGSGHIDMRIAPYVMALFALAMVPTARTPFTLGMGRVAIALLVLHTGYQAWSYARIDRLWQAQFAALEHIPEGTRVYGLAGVDCPETWRGDRMDHVQRMATVRRRAFTNGTWPPSCQQTFRIRPELPAARDPTDSELLVPADCRGGPAQAIPGALARLPRDRFDYLWLINIPRRLWPTRTWLAPVWHGERGILYRILTPAEARDRSRPRTIARRLA